jgi:NAD(P)-dependent dehydrogenase (short-subunit alcohol dehydrogenase family)
VERLSGKVAFITGSAGGIGFGIAHACVDQAMKVVLSDVDEAALEGAAAKLRDLGAVVMTVPLDVTDRDGWKRAVDRVRADIGPVQLLVNNAGVSMSGTRFDEVGPEMWDRVVSVNLTGVYNGVHFMLDDLRAAGGGHIVNTASLAGLMPGPLLAAYVASKFGVVGFSEALRLELAEWEIGVSVLCPGLVRTRLWRTSRAVRGLPDTDVPPDDQSGRTARAEMQPEEVGRRVLEAVRANELYIITHPEFRTALDERHQRELRGFDRAEAFAS